MKYTPEQRLVTEARLPALLDSLEGFDSFVGVPIFETLAEAEAWEAKNPGKRALTMEPSTPDTTPPTWNATLAVGTRNDTSVVVTASALATDDRTLAGYEVTYNGSTWTRVVPSGKNFTLAGLTPSTAYVSVKLRAKDAAGNTSPALAVPSFTTAAKPIITTKKAPDQITGLWFDYNADAAESVETYTGGGVSKLLDSTPGARHMVAAAEGTAPTLATINGRQAVKFSAAASTRLRHIGTFTQDSPWTLAIIASRDSAVSGAALDLINGRIELNGNGALGRSGSTVTAGFDWTAGSRLLVLTDDGTTLSITDGTTSKTTTSAATTLAKNIALGASYGGSGAMFTDVTVGRAMGWDRALTATEIAELHNWAKTEWGVA